MQHENPDRCPICLRNTEKPIPPTAGDYSSVQCSLCGEYKISGTLFDDLHSLVGDLRPYLTAATRQASVAGTKLLLDSRNWREHAEAHRHTSVHRKTEKLLRVIETRSHFPGDPVNVDLDVDYPLIDAVMRHELEYFLKHSEDLGYINRPSQRETAILTVKAWVHLDPSSGGGGIPGRVFVAMSFDSSLDEIYRLGIKPAIEQDCGLEAVRIDEVPHTEKICDRMLAEIRRCQFLVADYTQHKGGVYFEDGFAMGLGRVVIRCCQADDFGLHFDTRQYPHIKWSDKEDLRAQLADRIRALNLNDAFQQRAKR